MAGSPRPERWIRRSSRGAGFCLQPHNRGRPALVKVVRKGPLQLRIANLTKAGTLERRGEGGLPSLLQPWVPRTSSAPSDLESFIRRWLADWQFATASCRSEGGVTLEDSSTSVRREAGSDVSSHWRSLEEESPRCVPDLSVARFG
jgi:hypothetical protein